MILLISASCIAGITGVSHQSLACGEYFWDTVSQPICLGWLWTKILLISASWVAGITGVNHWCPAHL
jgi:hypothetical protein